MTRASRAQRLLFYVGAVALAASLTPLAFALGAQDAAADSARGGRRITKVELRGVTKFAKDEILEGLVTKPSECKTFLYTPICLVTKSPMFTTRRYLNVVELRRDVLRIRLFYWRRGYRDTRATSRTENDGDGVKITFEIDERAPTIADPVEVVQTDSVLPTRAVQRALQLRSGDPLDLFAVDTSMALLRDELWERGYADARVELDTSGVSDSLNTGPVRLTTRPGARATVREVTVTGNKKVSERTIRRLLSFRPGDLYRRSDVLESQRDLYLSGLFAEVDLAAPPAGDSAKVVELRVAEADLRQLELTAGFTNADFVQLDAQFTRYNFLGAARRLTLRGTVSNLLAAQLNDVGFFFYDVTQGAQGSERDIFLSPTWQTSIEFSQPWFFSPRNQLGASIFAHRRSVPGIVIDRGNGATAALTRTFGPRVNSTLGYTFEAAKIEARSDVYFCVTFGVCVPSTIAVIAGRNPLSPLSLVTQIDRANDLFAPNRGYRLRLDVEHASGATFSDFQYNRVAVTGSSYFRVSRTSTLAARVRLGWVDPLRGTNRALGIPPGSDEELIVHPRKRFYSGGSQSVRGYGENQLGPRVLTISPEALTDTSIAVPCTTAELQDLSCDPNRAGVSSDDFQPQPTGGTSLAEASVEFRFPLRFYKGLTGAVFVDGAIIGTDRFSNLLGATGTVTPGFGVRLDTPVGPVRLDLGIRPGLTETLPVITQVTQADGTVQLVTLDTPRRYNPVGSSGNWFNQILNRLTLHLAIGPAF